MKYLLPLLIVLVLFTGCEKAKIQELERKNTDLQRQYDKIARDMSTQSQYIDDVTNAINNVYGNMQRITEGETMLSKTTKELEMGKGAVQTQLRERIINQIAGIDTYLIQNRKKISDLEAKLKSARGKYAGLEKLVQTLKESIAEKERSLAELENKLKEKNIQIESLEERIAKQTQETQQKDAEITTQKKQINSAFYAVGKSEELESKGIISAEGGFPFGLFGKTNVLASGFDKTDFTTIDRYEQTTIEINGRVSELIPKRKENYYTLTQGETTTKLLILDPDKFWQDSYLVIVTK